MSEKDARLVPPVATHVRVRKVKVADRLEVLNVDNVANEAVAHIIPRSVSECHPPRAARSEQSWFRYPDDTSSLSLREYGV